MFVPETTNIRTRALILINFINSFIEITLSLLIILSVKIVIYTSHKAEVWRPIVREFEERTGITVTPYIEEIEIATPWTMCNYVNTPEGSAYGFELKDWDNMMPRMMMMGTEFPVKGLKFVGAASIRGDGYNSAIFSGDTLAKKTLAEMKAEEA